MKQITENIEKFVKCRLETEGTGHDWLHIDRVRRTALNLAKKYSCDLTIIELSALLHDLIDDKLSDDIRMKTDEVANLLREEGLDSDSIQEVLTIISTISFKGGKRRAVSSIEAQIVQDADRLDAMGAIGIARVFSYGGSKGNLIYDPAIPTRDSMTCEEYRTIKSTSINHFYEKLLKLKDLMNTEEGKMLAQQRHQFMVDYLSQFFLEWEGPNRGL
ncbi:HD domain-containing protein [Peribacillus frigoritolerans]|uniref:HD domain-containing protein n=1 Tax=Peribacillus frigoritolerans TaxID=450367 RepID=UPI00105A9B74|nr:HD domain-containing protein [Peribacillus frigoritolerans]TDL82672.1 HD domain-containing protein [Peribacillus frigoritolerans]